MDLLSFLAVSGLTLFLVLLCIAGMYANTHKSENRRSLIIERDYRTREK